MLAKQFLKQRGVAFEDVLLETNASAKAYIVERLGRSAKVPVIEIGDRIFSLNPFDPNRLAAELALGETGDKPEGAPKTSEGSA